MPKELTAEQLIKYSRLVLENPFWIPDLNDSAFYDRLHDDHDGTFKGVLNVAFSSDGDAWIGIDGRPHLRFRNFLGGGMSLRVRNALMILAFAIKLDNEEHPQDRPQEE